MTSLLVMRATPSVHFDSAPTRARTTFSDRLLGALDLQIGEAKFSFPAGSLERIWTKATTYGFEAEVVIGVVCDQENDPVFSAFTTSDLITATLSLSNGNEGYADEDAPPWKIIGPVTSRRMEETTAEDKTGQPVVLRRYRIRFLDPAQVFWGQHRPTELWTDASMKDVITAHTPKGVQFKYAWPRIDEAMEMLFVGTGSHAKASFYDFVMGFVEQHQGVVELDPATVTYRFSSAKSNVSNPMKLDPDIVRHLQIVPVEPLRRAAAVLNAYSEAAVKKTAVTNSDAVKGVRLDTLLRTPVQTPVDRRIQVETARVASAAEGITVSFSRLPPAFPLLNGAVALSAEFSAAHLPFGKTYRVIEVELDAINEAPVDVGDPDDHSARFVVSYDVRAERGNDSRPRFPPLRRTEFPLLVEGKVLAAVGAKTDRTWSAQEDEVDALDAYRVDIPLWNKTIKTPFIPNQMSGHFFFPAYKGERVLVALYFDHAEIVGYLDWAGKLAQTTQGNQILWGKGDKNETYARHVYEEQKPVFTIFRKLAKDTETIRVSEGVIRFEVQEVEEAATAEPSYDLTPKTEAAKDELASEVRSTIGNVSSTYESNMASTKAAVDGAKTEIESALTSSATTVNAKVAAAEGQLQTMMSSATEAIVDATNAIDTAKAELVKALYE